MNIKQIGIILIASSVAAVLVSFILFSVFSKSAQTQKAAFDDKIALLEHQVTVLDKELQKEGDDRKKQAASLPQKEIIQREVVHEKSQDELLTSAVAKTAPAVVSIVISKDVLQLEVTYENPFGDDPLFRDFGVRIPVYRQKGVTRQKVGAGTGFLITHDGYIITNRHVVSDTSAQYTVLLASGAQKPASVIHRDEVGDLAIIKIEGTGFPIVALGNSSSIKLGQTVAAIGNALGEYNNSVSTGIISGLNRTIQASNVNGTNSEELKGVIQTDAAINPGNSGGPLIDLNGNVIGVNVATVVGSNSISFSIPINSARELIKKVI